MYKIFLGLITVTLFIFLASTFPYSSKKLDVQHIDQEIAEIGDRDYYRKTSIKLLYGGIKNVSQAFECQNYSQDFLKEDEIITTAVSCTIKYTNTTLIIITKNNKNEKLKGVSVCYRIPSENKKFLQTMSKIEASHKSTTIISDKSVLFSNGTFYYLGRTKTPFQNFDNFLTVGFIGDLPIQCWHLERK